MEVSEVRKRVLQTVDRARRAAADRRALADEATGEYQLFLDRIAVPLFRQVANILRAEKHPFSVATPGSGVRLMSDRSTVDYVELTLDTAGTRPQVIAHVSRGWGQRVLESETAIGDGGPVRSLTEEDVLAVVLKAIEPFVER